MNYVALTYAGLFALIVGVGLIIGLTRGLKRSVLRLAVAIVSALLAIGLLPVILDWVVGLDISSFNLTVEGQAAGSLQQIIDIYVAKYASEYIAADSATAGLAAALPKMLVAVFVFGVVFAVFNLIGFVVYLLTKGLIDGKIVNGRKIKKNKLLGGLVGAVNGVLIAFLALSPALGLADFVQPFAENETVQTELAKLSPEALKYINEYINYGKGDGDFVKKILGFNDLDVEFFNRITKVKNSDGTELSAADFKEFSAVVDDAAWFYVNMDALKNFKDLPDDEFAALVEGIVDHANGIIDFLFENDITNIILTDGVKYLKDNKDSLSFLKDIPAEFKSAVGVIIDEIIGDGTTEAAHTVLKDLITLAGGLAPEVKYFMANSELFSKLTDSSLPLEQKAELFAHIQTALDALFTDGKGKITDTLIGKAAASLIQSGGLDSKLPQEMQPIFETLKESVFIEDATQIEINTNLYDALGFVVGLMNSDAFGILAQIGGEGADMMTLVGSLLQNDGFKTLLKDSLSKPAVAKTLSGMVSALVPDKTLSKPLGEFFGELGNSTDIDGELNGLLTALGEIQNIMAAMNGGEGSIAQVLGGVVGLAADQSGQVTLTGKVFLSIVSNTLTNMANPDAEDKYISVSTLDQDGWNKEIALIGNLLTKGAEIAQAGDQQAMLLLLPELGEALDDLKASTVLDESYNMIIGTLFTEMKLGDMLAQFGISSDANYKEIDWELTFNLAAASASIMSNPTNLENIQSGVGEFIGKITGGEIDLSDPEDAEAVGEFFGTLTESLGEPVVAIFNGIFEELVTAVGGDLNTALQNIPEGIVGVFAVLIPSGGEQEIDPQLVSGFVQSFFTYLYNVSVAQAA